MRQQEAVRDTIYIGKEAYMYLLRTQRAQRGCSMLTEEQEGRIWDRMPKSSEGLRKVTRDSFGGAAGGVYGRWTSWSLEKVKQILSEAGYTWKEGEPEKVIYVGI